MPGVLTLCDHEYNNFVLYGHNSLMQCCVVYRLQKNATSVYPVYTSTLVLYDILE